MLLLLRLLLLWLLVLPRQKLVVVVLLLVAGELVKDGLAAGQLVAGCCRYFHGFCRGCYCCRGGGWGCWWC